MIRIRFGWFAAGVALAAMIPATALARQPVGPIQLPTVTVTAQKVSRRRWPTSRLSIFRRIRPKRVKSLTKAIEKFNRI